jgi:hypothetical protein
MEEEAPVAAVLSTAAAAGDGREGFQLDGDVFTRCFKSEIYKYPILFVILMHLNSCCCCSRYVIWSYRPIYLAVGCLVIWFNPFLLGCLVIWFNYLFLLHYLVAALPLLSCSFNPCFRYNRTRAAAQQNIGSGTASNNTFISIKTHKALAILNCVLLYNYTLYKYVCVYMYMYIYISALEEVGRLTAG